MAVAQVPESRRLLQPAVRMFQMRPNFDSGATSDAGSGGSSSTATLFVTVSFAIQCLLRFQALLPIASYGILAQDEDSRGKQLDNSNKRTIVLV